MARYRVGNRYLSEREYHAEVTSNAGCVGALVIWGVLSFASHRYVVNAEWPQALRFVVAFVVPGAIAAPLVFGGRVLLILVGVIVLLFVLAVAGSILWRLA